MGQKNTRVTRFVDVDQEPKRDLTPIEGYEKTKLMTLQESMESMKGKLHNLATMVQVALRNSHDPADGLKTNESAAIHLYTIQWPESHASVYAALNEALRSQDRNNLKPWFPYLKLLLTGLFKLPPFRGIVWRGVRGNLSDKIKQDLFWWGMSSCTENIEKMKDFLGPKGERTLFYIECTNGKSIRAHSHFEKEEEVLLLPGTYFKVISKWSPSADVYIVHLRQTEPPHQTLVPPFDTASASVPEPPIERLRITPSSVKPKAEATSTATASKPTTTTVPKPTHRNPDLESLIAEHNSKKELSLSGKSLTDDDMQIVSYYAIGKIKVKRNKEYVLVNTRQR